MDGFAQAQKGKMMNDLISRQAAIDAIAEFLYYPNNWDAMRMNFDLSDWEWKIEGILSELPLTQSEAAIPISWIEKEIERIENRKNRFSALDIYAIKALVKRWEKTNNDR